MPHRTATPAHVDIAPPPTPRRLRIPASEKWTAAGLIALALVPALAGGMRVGGIAADTSDTPVRFADDPLPVVLHIVGALVYSLVGAFQFLPTLRRRAPGWHRFAGRYLLVPSGFVVALSGLWMNAAYVLPPIDGVGLLISRYAVGAGMTVFLVLGLVAVARRRFDAHGAWMIRAYALAMGAGTQVITAGVPAILGAEPDEFWRLVQMDAGWVINIVVAEVVIGRMRRARRQ